MKVAIVSHLFPTSENPVHGIFVAEQARALQAQGAEIVVLSPQWTRGAQELPGLGVPVEYGRLRWRGWVPPSMNVLLAEPSYRGWLVRRLQEERPDVVHAHYGFPDGVAAVGAARQVGIPVVVTLHGSDVNRQMQRPFVGAMVASRLRPSDAIICVGETMRARLAHVDSRLADGALIVSNGFNANEIGFVPGRRRNRVLFVGSLREVKNPLILIDAFARIADSTDLDLVMVGEGPLRRKLRERIASSGLEARVSLLGEVAHAELKELYASAKVLVLPSRSEGLPIVVLEALASGVPVVASRVGSIPDLVDEGVSGHLVEPGDVEGLAAALSRAIDREWDHAGIASQNGSRSWDVNAETMIGVYQSVVAARKQAKRLAYVCLQATRQGQASHAHVHEVIHGLRSLGWGVELFEPPYATRGRRPGPAGRFLHFISVLSAFRARVHDFDVVYVRDHPFATPAMRAARRVGVPAVLEVNSPFDEIHISYPWTRVARGWFSRGFLKRARTASGIVVVTDQLRDWVARLGISTPTTVIGNGADPERFHPGASNRRLHPYALFFGVLARWQGVRALLDAAGLPEWPRELDLAIAGEGVEEPAVYGAMSRGLAVRYEGSVSYKDMPALLAGASVCVIPKSTLGNREATGLSPVKLFEAMSSGVPVVVTDIPGQADIVRRHQCGVVVAPDDAAQLAIGVAQAVGDPVEAAAMGARGRAAVLASYSWAERARETDRFIRSVRDGAADV